MACKCIRMLATLYIWNGVDIYVGFKDVGMGQAYLLCPKFPKYCQPKYFCTL